MPIRINLLAESQAAEEVRRRDPVKRAAYVAVSLIVMVLVWISSLQVKIMADNSRLTALEVRMASHTNEYSQLIKNKAQLVEVNGKLVALNRLASERFLQATLLDSLMHAPVDGIQVTRLRTEQGFDQRDAPTGPDGKPLPGKTATVAERIRLVIEAKDSSANPGNEQIKTFREALAHTPYSTAQNLTTNNILLKSFSSPQLEGDTGKPYVLFSLECQYPERIH